MGNNKINSVIVEDEPRNIELLRKMLTMYCPQVNVLGDANSVESAVKLIRESNPDLVFLDIEISGGNAFQLLDILQPVSFQIIFITAYDNYLLKAIRCSALDYLFKPVNIQELIAAVNKSTEKISSNKSSGQIESLLKSFSGTNKLPTIAIPTEFGFYFVDIHNIVRCEAKGSYTILYMHDKKKYTTSKSLKEFEDLLPADVFFRAHHSHLVNLRFIVKYHKGKGGIIEMTDRSMIPLAARRKNDFLSLVSPGE